MWPGSALRKGKEIELSGTDPFNGIILPLVKALEYANKMYKPRGHVRVDPTLLLCICVLDAPMLLVESPTRASDPILTPWVRITRIQASLEPHRHPYQFYAIDMIHVDSLESIVVNHVMPFSEEFSNRALRLGAIWKEGGVVASLANCRITKDLKFVDRKVVRVRVRPSAPIISVTYSQSGFDEGPAQRS